MKNFERHFFAGGNTKYGFFSYFDYIINPQKGTSTYILKGASGVGKSTMMKKFAKAMKDKQYFIEYIHCASDEDSLDAICIPEIGVTILDGTAPHTIDPKLPGAFDHIINMGDWLNKDILMKQKDKIAIVSNEKSRLYREAYSYLKSASHILDINHSIYECHTDSYALTCLAEELSRELFSISLGQKGAKRCLFANAFTSNGLIDYSHTLDSKIPSKHAISEVYDIWEVCCDSICSISEFLENISLDGIKHGYDIECFYHPIDPHKIQHLLIPKLGIAFMSKGNLNLKKKSIDLNQFLDNQALEKHKETIRINEELYSSLLLLASQTLAKTKLQHDLLENIYAPAMDYSKVDLLVAELIHQYERMEENGPWA